MSDEYKNDLMNYRLERAHECIKDAESDITDGSLYSAANRLYYAVFNAMRGLLAYDNLDFSKHSGVISYIRSQYIKTGIIDLKFSELIRNAESIRSDCDYKDFYMPVKEELEKYMPIVKEFIACIETSYPFMLHLTPDHLHRSRVTLHSCLIKT